MLIHRVHLLQVFCTGILWYFYCSKNYFRNVKTGLKTYHLGKRNVSSLEGISRCEECLSQVTHGVPNSLEDTTSKTDVGHPDELMAETVEAGMQGVENHMFIIVYHLELPPTQDASHHHDYEPFLVWNPEQNLHL